MMTREELIAKVQEVARRRGATVLSMKQFTREARVCNIWIIKLFDSWSKLCEAAGIASYPHRVGVTDEELFREMRKTFLDLGGVPTLKLFVRGFRYTASIFTHRGWSWTVAKIKFRAWAETHDPAFPYLDQLPDGSAVRAPNRPRGPAINPMAGVHAPLGVRLIGEPLGFGPLATAPVNEMGVLALFVLVAERLGYSIQLLNPRFPDCEARRRVPGNRWEAVSIELEWRSSNFLDHRHDRTRCQVIVCWEADWRPNDIEVLELRSVVAQLMAEDARRRAEDAERLAQDAERRRQARESDAAPAQSEDGSEAGGHRSRAEERGG
jgi:hypothetical protein